MTANIMTERWKCTVEYDGGPYRGWQRQEDDTPTVQAAIEHAIFKFSGHAVTIHVAGRTDAGVHARAQVFHVDLPARAPHQVMSGFHITKAINANLRPHPIAVLSTERVGESFHARFSATNKLYTYRILRRTAPPTFDRDYVWYFRRDLDVDAMRRGADLLLGHHDFTTFRDSECQAKSPEKTLDRLDIEQHGDEILIHAEGRSFLHHQVRNMVGTLTLVGDGKWQPQDIATALAARDRTKGGPTAPACGLYLVRVDY